MVHDGNFRQIAVWTDLNSPLHYQTLFAIQQLVDKLNKDPTNTQVTVSFRPYFNMFRAYRVNENNHDPRSLICSTTIPNYCLDKQTYGMVMLTAGNLTSVDDVFQEMVRQITMFKKDNSLYQRYIYEFTISCLLDTNADLNYSKCSESVLKFLTDVESTDITAAAIVENINVKKKLLETNLASIDRFGTYPDGIAININNEFIRVK
jgi:hypothetical protein